MKGDIVMQTILFTLLMFSSEPGMYIVSTEELLVAHNIICVNDPLCQITIRALLSYYPELILLSPRHPTTDTILLYVTRCGDGSLIRVTLGIRLKEILWEVLTNLYIAYDQGMVIFSKILNFLYSF